MLPPLISTLDCFHWSHHTTAFIAAAFHSIFAPLSCLDITPNTMYDIAIRGFYQCCLLSNRLPYWIDAIWPGLHSINNRSLPAVCSSASD
ncbi:hypothetical protein QL285_002561 [Trifolium repens]|nr:hypothetical protein QL285_002561 [Trifolium repens]